ncbi:MAG: ASCH domain-containing protein [Propionibacteriaceae bacterium]|nr:ASCH domain-containing protein [Propionibacteriaceae bacterium]
MHSCDDGVMDTEQIGLSESSILKFWALAKGCLKDEDVSVSLCLTDPEVLAPPAWSFGDSPEMANELLALVLEGKKTATSGLYQEYVDEDEPLPQVGDLSIIMDGQSEPKVLIQEAEVRIVPFIEVSEEQALAEGEGDLETWREIHREVWKRRGFDITDNTLVVWERFTVLWPDVC